MANLKKALPENAEGNYFVDSTCINCSISRHYAPEIFGDNGTHAFVKRQPQNQKEEFAVQQALLACPVASIGAREKIDLTNTRDSFPVRMTEDVYLNGYNHRKSYGAHSYFLQTETGNWLVDSPRFLPDLVNRFEAMGGIKYIFLTHSDDVADADKYARHFNAIRIIHQLESHAQPEAEMILEGDDSHRLDAGEIHFTPGHTEGHLVLLWQDKYLFTGDHYAWDPPLNHFGSFREHCWYSWDIQIESVRKMAAFKHVIWVFPGHGKWGEVPEGQFPHIISQSVKWMLSVR